MIEVDRLRKTYRKRVAIERVSFRVEPGRVTGFLGPNGAGKSTTMRLVLGLARADAGAALINGAPIADHADPLRQVGAALDTDSLHPGRSARAHLRSLAATHRLSKTRVDEVLDMVGLESVSERRLGTFSLGMRQRLGLAAALLGDPKVLILDEPLNGLDPEGVLWARRLLRRLAEEGRTIFVSSHLMSEMAIVADHLIIIGKGRVLRDAPLAEVLADAPGSVRVVAAESARLCEALRAARFSVDAHVDGVIHVSGATCAEIGRIALDERILVSELGPSEGALEAAYFRLTSAAVEHRAGGAA